MADLGPIPIIGGTGALGAGLATRWAQAGVPVVLGSRSAERAEEAAAKVRAAVPGADVTGLHNERGRAQRPRSSSSPSPSAPSRRTSTTCARRWQPGQILVDCTVPLAAAVSGKATRSLGVWQGSAAQQAQEMVPEGVTVVAALHTVGAPTLADAEAELGEDVLVCGDRKADKARVARLIELIPGLRAVNAGAAGDGPHRRAADADADLGQQSATRPTPASASPVCPTPTTGHRRG